MRRHSSFIGWGANLAIRIQEEPRKASFLTLLSQVEFTDIILYLKVGIGKFGRIAVIGIDSAFFGCCREKHIRLFFPEKLP
jgi:hypothetical protein